MAHGGPDWGINLPTATVYGVDDMGELAARLGSIVSYDRRGNVIFMDDFQSSLSKWVIALSGGGGDAIAISNERSKSGSTSCKVTTGAVLGDQERLSHYFGYPVLSKMGIELSFTLGPPDIESLLMSLAIDNGVNVKAGSIKLIRSAPGSSVQTLQYRNAANVFVPFGTAIIWPAADFFVPAKLVIDMVNDTYVRFLIANYNFPMTDIPIHVTGVSPTPGVAVFAVIVENGAAGNHSLYLDDAIITQNEP